MHGAHESSHLPLVLKPTVRGPGGKEPTRERRHSLRQDPSTKKTESQAKRNKSQESKERDKDSQEEKQETKG